MARVKDLRNRLEWSQAQLGVYLGVTQPNIARLEGGAPETGPVRRLLDQLGAALDKGVIAAPLSPEEAMAIVMAIEKPPDDGSPVSRSGPRAA
jgi:transcriptional regulator with XRE-family HTH domain